MASTERDRIALRIERKQRERLDGYVKIADSKNRNQFILDAIEFYGGYIT